jgi:hypothetical protein
MLALPPSGPLVVKAVGEVAKAASVKVSPARGEYPTLTPAPAAVVAWLMVAVVAVAAKITVPAVMPVPESALLATKSPGAAPLKFPFNVTEPLV